MALQSSSVQFELPILEVEDGKDEYEQWRDRVQSFFEAKELWPYVSGVNPSCPDETTGEPNSEFKAWFSNDKRSLGWLLSAISDPLVTKVLHLHTSKEVWDFLNHLHTASSRNNDDRHTAEEEEEECDHVEKKIKNCHMVPWIRCGIGGIDDDDEWRRISLPESRYRKVPCLISTTRLYMGCAKIINTKQMEPNTIYTVSLVYKLQTPNKGLGFPFQKAEIRVGTFGSLKQVCLEYPPPPEADNNHDVEKAHEREGDGDWLGLNLGQFTNIDGRQGSVILKFYNRVTGREPGHTYEGLIVEGIELKPLN